MGFKTKRSLGQKARAAARKSLLQSTAAVSEAAEGKSEPQLVVTGESLFPLELKTDEVKVKQEEPTSTETVGQFLPQDELEVKEELLLDPDRLDPVESEQDPIGYNGSRSLLQQQQSNEENDRCQFCWKLFQERGGRAAITKARVGYVLGLSNWGTPGRCPDCCEECKKMFDMFYEFKQGCLVALARPAELFVAGSSKLFEPEVVCIEGRSVELHQDVGQAESIICSEKGSEGMPSRQHLMTHYSVEPTVSGQGKRTRCRRCGKRFSNTEIYLQHKPTCVHTPRKPSNRPASKFTCSLCPRKFSREQELAYHTDKHNGIRTIPCRRKGCIKMFYHPDIRRRHEQICGQRIEPAICNVCGNIFHSEASLRKHTVIHGDPRFICEICNKAFHRKRSLQNHYSVHSDERRFQCQVCSKRFKSHEANRVHQRIHTDETPYVCHLCGQRFRYNCLLKTHLEKGHESGPW